MDEKTEAILSEIRRGFRLVAMAVLVGDGETKTTAAVEWLVLLESKLAYLKAPDAP